MQEQTFGDYSFLVSEKGKRGYLITHPLRTAELDFPSVQLTDGLREFGDKGFKLLVTSGFDFYRNPMKLLAGLANTPD